MRHFAVKLVATPPRQANTQIQIQPRYRCGDTRAPARQRYKDTLASRYIKYASKIDDDAFLTIRGDFYVARNAFDRASSRA